MQLRGNGTLSLSDAALTFVYLAIDRTIAIDRRAIRRSELVRSHLGKAGPKMIKIWFVNDEHMYDSVAFAVKDRDAWRSTIEAIIEDNAARVGRPAAEPSPLAATVEGKAVLLPAWTRPSVPLGLALAMAVGGIAAIPGVGPYLALGLAALGAGGAIAQWIARRRGLRELEERGRLYEAGPEGLVVGGELVVEAWRLRAGLVVPNEHGASLVLSRGALLPDVVLQVASVDEGRDVLRALGVESRAVTRKVTSRMFGEKGFSAATLPALAGVGGGILLGVLGFPEIGAGLGLAGVAWMMLAFYTAGFVKTRVTIGADGVRVAWMGRERIVPLADIARVEATRGFMGARQVTLHLANGERFDLTVAMRGNNLFEPFDPTAETALLVERIRAAMQIGQDVQTADLEAWIDERGSLSVSDWMRELRLHVRTAMRERGAELVEKLLALAEHAAAEPAVRAAAAVALGPALDENARERLKGAAESTAVPKLRVALEAAAEDRDADLVEAFRELADAHRVKVRVELDEELMAEAEQEVESLLAAEDAPYRGRAG